MTWDRWFTEVIEKAEQLELRLTVHRGPEKEIQDRPPPSEKPTAKPRRRLTVPPKTGGAPSGGGWRRTPNGWARGQGATYEWQPANWRSGAEKQAVELNEEEKKDLFFWSNNQAMSTDPKKHKTLIDAGFLEPTGETGWRDQPMMVVSAKGHEWIRQDRVRRLKLAVQEGTIAHEDVGMAMFAANDAYNRMMSSRARGDKAPEEAFAAAIDHLYQLEKLHNATPTTARGVREALGVPAEWQVLERTARDPARTISIDHDYRMKLSWSRGEPMAYREWWNHTKGGFWQVVDKKKKPARELIAKHLEKQRKEKIAGEEYRRQSEAIEAAEAEQGPVIRGPDLQINTSSLKPPGKLSVKRFQAGLEWAEKVMREKSEWQHQDTQRAFHQAMAGERNLGSYVPTPSQYDAIKNLESIAGRKLFSGKGRAGLEPALNPELTPSKEAFWRGVQAFARQGLRQWESGPMEEYVQRFRDYVEAHR